MMGCEGGKLGEKGMNGLEEMGGAGMGWKDEKGQRLNNWMQGSIPRHIFLGFSVEYRVLEKSAESFL